MVQQKTTNAPAIRCVITSVASIHARPLAALTLNVPYAITSPFANAPRDSPEIHSFPALHHPAPVSSAARVNFPKNNFALFYFKLFWNFFQLGSDYCTPSPCGSNTRCRVENSRAVCSCLDGFMGNPIQGCRRECESDFECDASRACMNFRCQDPCGTCGTYADCNVRVRKQN
jgi:hypothetical protein